MRSAHKISSAASSIGQNGMYKKRREENIFTRALLDFGTEQREDN